MKRWCWALATCAALVGSSREVAAQSCEPPCPPGFRCEGRVCEPECPNGCGSGRCIAPNVCEGGAPQAAPPAPSVTPGRESSQAACQNGEDDDNDGHVDCLDTECMIFTVCTESHPLYVRPPDRNAAPVETVPALKGPLFAIFLGGGGSNAFAGGDIALQALLGTGGHYFVLGARGNFGVATAEWDAPAGELTPVLNGDAGYRGIFRGDNGFGGMFTAMLSWAHQWSFVTHHDEAMCALGRIGGGFVFGQSDRFNFGVEVTFNGGYCFDYAKSVDASGVTETNDDDHFALAGGNGAIFVTF